MLPGPNYVYKCPKCGNRISCGSLKSGNTYNAIYYSDGKMIAPMLPESPSLTKCKKCNEIFWLSDLESIGIREIFIKTDFNYENQIFPWNEIDWPKTDPWEDVDWAEFLSIDDYFTALEIKAGMDNMREVNIRTNIFWAYNDKIRNGQKIFVDSNDELRWTDNCKKLLAMLNPSKVRQKLMVAEIYRNLGEFDQCIAILEDINSKNLLPFKEALIRECEYKNRWVVELDE